MEVFKVIAAVAKFFYDIPVMEYFKFLESGFDHSSVNSFFGVRSRTPFK